MQELVQGLYKQTNVSKNPPSTWAQAKNIVVGRKLRSVSNEEGFVNITDVSDLEGTIIGCIPLNESAIVFTEFAGEGIIGEVSATGYEVIIRSTGLNFNINNPISGDYIYNFREELTIVFWDGLADNANPPKLLNTDCLPFKVDVDKRPIDISDLILLKLFPDIGCTDIVLNNVLDGGGTWDTGAHYFTKAYVLPDNSITNYTPLSNPVFIIKDLTSNDYNLIDGGEAGTNTTKSISLTFNNLITNYKKIRIACISKINGVLSAFTFPDREIRNTELTIRLTRTEDIINTSVGSIIVPNANFNRINSGVFLENRLHIANLKQEDKLDYQAYANNIKVKWIRNQNIKLGQYEGSYKDPIILFDKKGFAADEVYGFVIAFGLKDGTISEWFHIPGRDSAPIGIGGFGDRSLISTINIVFPSPNYTEALLVDPNAQYFQLFNSAKATGEMGFWENENETYADVDCSDIKDATGVIGTLRNEKVRHHKFPSYVQLNSWGSPFYDATAVAPANNIVEFRGITENFAGANAWFGPPGVKDRLRYVWSNSLALTVDPVYFTQLDDSPLILEAVSTFTVLIRIDFEITAGCITDLEFIIENPSGTELKTYSINLTGSAFAWQAGSINEVFQFKLYTGYKIRLSWTKNSKVNYPRFRNGNSLTITVNNFNEITTDTKAMGVRFEDIYVPPEIADKVTCHYFGYLQRDLQNNIKVATSLIDRDVVAEDTDREFRIRNFDLGANKPQLEVNYLKSILYYATPAVPKIDNIYGIVLTAEPQIYQQDFKAVEKSEYKLLIDFLESGETREGNDFGVKTVNTYTTEATTPTRNFGTLVSLYTYRKDLYFNYSVQKVVIMGYKPIAATQEMYGGDVHINYISLLHGLQIYRAALPTIVYPELFYFLLKNYVTENVTNSEMRYSDESNKYAPRDLGFFVTSEPFIYLALDYSQANPDAVRYTEIDKVDYRIPTWNLYNKDYTSVNDIIPQLIFECNDDCNTFTNSFPFRIARSLISGNEDGTASWRKFLANDYYDMPYKDKGSITRIVNYGNSLVIHQTYSTFLASTKDVITTAETDLYIGKGDIFDREPKELMISGSSNAYAGCQSRWAGVVTKHGYIFWDMLAGKVFIFTGKIKEISSEGLKFYLEKNGQLLDKTIDNPFIDRGLCVGYDEKENRALFTKTDSANSFTLSYSFHLGKWVCNHDYIPNGYYNNRAGEFALRSAGGNSGGTTFPAVFKMNIENTYGKYFLSATTFPSYLDVVISTKELVKFISIIWETEVYELTNNETNRYYDETITQIMCYDNYRCTGLIDLQNNKNIVNDNLRRTLTTWMFNEIRDIVIDKDNITIFENGDINLANLNNNTLFFKKSKFIDNFIVIRLQYDNLVQKGIDIKGVTVTAIKSER